MHTTELEPTTEAAAAKPTGFSLLFPTISAEDWAAATEVAEAYTRTNKMECDADDVLLAGNLANFGEHALKVDPAAFDTAATRVLFDSGHNVGLGSLLVLAKMVKRLHGAIETGVYSVNETGMDIVQTLSAVIAMTTRAATPRKKFKHGKG